MLSEHGTVLVLGISLQAPEVMLDDVVYVRLGRFRPQRLRNLQGGSSTPARNVHALRGDGCRLPLDMIESVSPL